VLERSIRKSQGAEEYPTHNKKKEDYLDCSLLRRNCLLKHVIEDMRKDRSDGNTRKKT